MRINRYVTTLVTFVICSCTVSAAVGLEVNFNFGTAATGSSTPGGLLAGVVNDVPLSGSTSILDAAGASTTLSASADGWQGDNNNDGDTKFDAAAATYTDGVARSLFWGGSEPTVTISGLDANTNYSVGIVSASTNATSHDWYLNGSQVADDLPEADGNLEIPFFIGTTDGVGDLTVLSNDHQAGVGLLQALVIRDELPLLPIDFRVDTTSGAVTIGSVSGSNGTLDVRGYSITSESGSLNPIQWNSFQEQGIADQGAGAGNTDPNDGVGWEQFSDGASDVVGEFNLLSSTLFGSGIDLDVNIGNLFTGGTNELLHDLLLEVELTSGAFQVYTATYFEGEALPGDYNGDSVVDAADYTLWRDNLGASDESAFAPGTGNGGGIDSSDYDFWRARFGNSAGSSTGNLAVGGVPEPGSVATILFGTALGVSMLAKSRRPQRARNVR